MSENLPPVKDESFPSGEDLEKTKSKKKKKAIGAFAVEAEPEPKPETKPEPSEEKQPSAPEDLEKLDDIERAEVISQLAAARRQELDATSATDETTTAEIAAAEAYLAAAETEGSIDNSFSEELNDLPENQPTPNDSTEIIIETNQPAEGEIPIAHPPTPAVSRPMFADRPEASGVNVPAAVSPETSVPLSTSLRRERKAQTDGLIVGGVVGYLIGRRRGRIKTEKRLVPVQKKLEKQVAALQTELVNKEQSIRQLARSNRAIGETIKTRSNERLVKPKRERSPLQAVAPEKIGHVLIAGSNQQEKSPANQTVKTERMAARQRAEQMDRQELLTFSQAIKVEGTSLRQIFETQLISENGLRRLVAEHLRGGNISRALRREIVERQIDFERDPILRDKHQSVGSEGAGKTALAAMLSRAGLPATTESTPIGDSKNPLAKKDQSKTSNPVQTAADVALVTLISVLSLVIFALLLRG